MSENKTTSEENGPHTAVEYRQQLLEKLPSGARQYLGVNGSLPKADELGHRTRFSDSSFYDEKCVLCGGTDGSGDTSLRQPCPHPVDEIPTELDAVLSDLSDWLEYAAMNLQNATPDGNNPAGYKGAHPCDCAHFAEEAIDLVRQVVAVAQARESLKGYADEPPAYPAIPSLDRPSTDTLGPNESRMLAEIEAAATPGNVVVAPFIHGVHEDERHWLLVGIPAENVAQAQTFATDLRGADARYVTALVRADRRLRRRGFDRR